MRRTKLAATLLCVLAVAGAATGCATLFHSPHIPPATYWVYVGAEAADRLHRIRYGPDGAVIEQTTEVGDLPSEIEGPHGVALSPDGEHVYVATGHGIPDGKLWKFEAGADTLVAGPVALHRFPATVSVSPDGLYAIVANYDLHGEPQPSTLSLVFTPEMAELDRIETCAMPHGGRFSPDGRFHYSVCTADGVLVEIDASDYRVSRRLELGAPEPPPATEGTGAAGVATPPSQCLPNWVEPSPDGATLWVACGGSNEVLEVDAEHFYVMRRYPAGAGPYHVAISPDGRWLVVTLREGKAVQRFDLTWTTPPRTVPTTTSFPHAVVITPDSRYAFVSVEGVGSEPGQVEIYLLDERFQRVATVAVAQQPAELAFWKMLE